MQCETRRQAAFTIVELLAASALLGLLSVILFSALNQVTTVITLSQGRSTTYQDVRTVLEQMSREIQQAVPYDNGNNNTFYAVTNSSLHFTAIIDNDKGREEVEVHYVFNGGRLYKGLVYDGSDYDVTNSAAVWYNTPDLTTAAAESAALDGVKSCTFEIWTNSTSAPYPPGGSPGKITGLTYSSNAPPAYIKVNLEVYDSQVIRRWGTAALAAASGQSNFYRPFHTLICLPRGAE